MGKHLHLPDEIIHSKIYFFRGQKVMLDRDLAELYGVETKVLKQAVKRNLERFPDDFMFELNLKEFENLRSQIVTSSWGGTRYLPMAFTEQGVAMLSSVLSSKQAIEVNIRIIRIFTKMREVLSAHKDVLVKLEQLENKTNKNEDDIQLIFEALKQLLNPPSTPRKRIGFKP
jgi:ORF6N domain